MRFGIITPTHNKERRIEDLGDEAGAE